jgi:CHAT domain-containing protein
LLEKIVAIAPDKPSAFLSMGNTWRAMGNLERDRQSDSKYDYLPWRCDRVVIPNEAEEYYQKALNNYTKAIESPSASVQTRARLNQFTLLLEIDRDKAKAESLSKIVAADLLKSRTSFEKVYAEINYAKHLSCLQQQNNQIAPEEIINWLKRAIETAKELGNISNLESTPFEKRRSKILESQGIGNWGSFYEYLSSVYVDKSSDYRQKALQLTREALYLAQPGDAPQIAYQWQWQLGRLVEADGNRQEAIQNYELAAKTLDKVRADLLTVNSDIQFSFRDNIEPLYRQLVNAILSSPTPKLESEALQKALDYTESLQLAELENFLRCSLSGKIDLDRVTDPEVAIVYPIVLKDRLSIIVKLPNKEQPLHYLETPISQPELQNVLQKLQKNLRESGKTSDVNEEASDLYRWLFQPIESLLDGYPDIETLVFIQDSLFRNIPMSVLYDGNKYLLEKKYSIAVVPSLKLFPSRIVPSPLKVFSGGVGLKQTFNNENITFLPIEQLQSELQGISRSVSITESLVNEQFTKSNIQNKFRSGHFSAIHWKTHGTYSSNPDNTYLVAYQEFIKPNDLDRLIQSSRQDGDTPLELLVLSACETAQGDRRAVLGLAGVAVRAGARSTLSTLWTADDAATTELMTIFYQQLALPGMTKAKALHQAQLALFKKYADPHTWANYMLVGNWL